MGQDDTLLRRALARAEEAMPPVSPALRFELRRKVLHVVVAVIAVPLLLLVPFRIVATIALFGVVVIASVWAVERRHIRGARALEPFHGPLAAILRATRRPNEDFPWSPVLYTLALLAIGFAHILLDLSWAIAFAAFAILGLGDAASALVGVAYGRTKLAWNRRKSWEGTAAGFVAGGLAGLVMAGIPFAFAGLVMPPVFIGIVLLGALAGALAETLPRVEDNLVVPLTAAAVMFALTSVLRVPLP